MLGEHVGGGLGGKGPRVCDVVAGDLDRAHVESGEEGAGEGDFGHFGGEAVKDFEVEMGIQA